MVPLQPPPPANRARKGSILILGLAWMGSLGFCLTQLWGYTYQPGAPSMAPEEWPLVSPVPLDPDRPTLVMLAHPKCPCTRASLGELARLMAQAGDGLAAHVLFFLPEEMDPDWARTDLWDSAAAIPGVRAAIDRGGAAAQAFGSKVSGQVLVFDRGGGLRFQGGITASRGHQGGNDGRSAILAFALGGDFPIERTPAYGCALQEARSPIQEGSLR